MNENFYNENIDNFNIYNSYGNGPFNDLDLDKYPGMFSNASDNKNKISYNINQDNYKNIYFNEEAIPYTPEMSEEPENPNKTKKIITDNIINQKNQQNDEKIFTFKENNSLNNFSQNNNMQENFEQNQSSKKYLNENLNNNQEFNNIIKANILNFEDIIRKKNNNNEIINKNKAKSNNIYLNNNNINNNSNFNEQINYNKKLYHNKKNSKNAQNKEINEMNKNNNIKKQNKSQKKPSNKKKIFEQNDIDVIEFESFINNKNKNNQKPIIENTVNNKSKDKPLNNNDTYKINEYFNIKTPKQHSENFTKIQKTKISQNQRKNNKIRNGNLIKKSKDISSDAIINYDNFKKRKSSKLKNNYNNNKTFAIEKENSTISSKSQMIKRKRPNTLRGIRKIDDNLAPKEVTEAKINLALENENIGKNIQKRFSPINNQLINFDNSKFEKYDTEQIKYGLIKGYANIHPEKDNGFLQRMQFEAIKRKNKDMKINELLEKNKNKYKIKESEREKAFDRLISDANRRLILKQEMIENERYLDEFKDLMDTKKYNGSEWNEIYKKRFKDYEDCKKKKIDIKRQNEKIKKMIKEEEEINMCRMKKLPKQKIKENTQRLYDDAKKREMLKNKNLKEAYSVKNYKLNKKDNILLTSFNDEEDASKYMKGHKSGTYKFIGENANNVSYNNYNIYNNKRRQKYFNDNKTFNNHRTQNMNKSFDKAIIRKSNKMTVTQFNNKRFDTNNNIQKYEKKKNQNKNKNNDYNVRENKSQFNDFTFNNNNNNNIDISSYFTLKNNNYRNGLSRIENNNNFSSQIPYGYNYNNYNIYNINNLNNNINNINTNDENDIDNYNLTNLAEQLIHTAAINKIESKKKKKLNMNNLYTPDNEIRNNNKYININENNYDNNNNANNYNFYYDNKNNIGEEKNQKFDFHSYNDAKKLVDQFLISKYEY